MNDILKTASMVAMFGNVLCDTKKEKNLWKKRMFLAVGLTFPDDWDELTEDEQERRFNQVIAIGKMGKKSWKEISNPSTRRERNASK